MKDYFKKHFVVIITLIVSIIASVVINFLTDISYVDNLIISLLILLITTFIFDYNVALDKISDKMDDYEHKLNPSSVQDFDTVDKCADAVLQIVKSGVHTIDFVSLDAKIRTPVVVQRRPMLELLDKMVTSSNIRLRYLSSIKADNLLSVFRLVEKSEFNQKNTFYAFCTNDIPFASFYIIDFKYLVIRTPYDSAITKRHYCLIEDQNICDLFMAWFDMLWRNAEMIDEYSDLIKWKDKVCESMSSESLSELESRIESIKNYI